MQELEGERTRGLEFQLRSARRALDVQQRIQAGIEKHLESIVRELQRARDVNATDLTARRRSDAHANKLLVEADAKVARAGMSSSLLWYLIKHIYQCLATRRKTLYRQGVYLLFRELSLFLMM